MAEFEAVETLIEENTKVPEAYSATGLITPCSVYRVTSGLMTFIINSGSALNR